MSKQINHKIAVMCVRRMDTLGYTGKIRDSASAEFMCGAAYGLEVSGDTSATLHLEKVIAFIIAPRGYSEIVRMSNPTYLTAEPG